MSRILTIALAISSGLVSCFGRLSDCQGSVHGVLENFSGNGPNRGLFANFDFGRDLTFEVGGVRIVNTPPSALDTESDFALRGVFPGNGSFHSILEFKELELEVPPLRNASSGFSIYFGLNGRDGGGVSVSVFDSDEFGHEESWLIDADWSATRFRPVPVADGTPVRIEYWFEEESRQFRVSYDANTGDEIDPVQFGPYVYDGAVGQDLEVFISTSAVGAGSQFHGVLSVFSVLPTDSVSGDFTGDGLLSISDLDMLERSVRINRPDSLFDVNADSVVDATDVLTWVTVVRKTSIGDVNLDEAFDADDLHSVLPFFEDGSIYNGSWSSGDWNGDLECDTKDLVLAFQDGGYEQGPRPAVVPEVCSPFLGLLGVVWLSRRAVVVYVSNRFDPQSTQIF